MKNETVINKFIIEVSLIDPITSIVNSLKINTYRDCDIKWLDSKLEGLTKLACSTLGLSIQLPDSIIGKIMNDYTKNQYIDRFTILLNYFKTI